MKDRESLKILSLIEEEEESHYRFGLRWFTYMCCMGLKGLFVYKQKFVKETSCVHLSTLFMFPNEMEY